ncbi:hypothetical protein Q8F55_003397 [Vanrija albida]|uniref:Uncharacterized protein n=1 Tax=Vanrija albida TaxID=181172 RepID=A0ABR3Q3W4_9TREE
MAKKTPALESSDGAARSNTIAQPSGNDPARPGPYKATAEIGSGFQAIFDRIESFCPYKVDVIMFTENEFDKAIRHGYTVYRMALGPYDNWLSREQFHAMLTRFTEEKNAELETTTSAESSL